MVKLVIVDFGKISNSYSVISVCRRLGYQPIISNDHQEIKSATHVILPGVGSAAKVMDNIIALKLDQLLTELASDPAHCPKILGICLGMQLLTDSSNETNDNSNVACLGLIPGDIRKFDEPGIAVPHMGWNLTKFNEHPVFAGLKDQEYVYYVHSYRYPDQSQYSVATFNYGSQIHTAAIAHHNLIGIQFHPERSGDVGEQIIKNFLAWS